MVESRPLQNILTHGTLLLGITAATFPIYIALVASTSAANDVMTTIIMETAKMLTVMDEIPDWSINMSTAILALLPPLMVVVGMQPQFVKGLIETKK